MGVPSVLSLPAAASGQAGCPPRCPWGHLLLLCAALLFPAPAAGTPGLPKAVVSLQPPWLQVFPGDNVTLSCQGAHSPGDNSTQWFKDGTAIPTQVQPSYSFKASKVVSAQSFPLAPPPPSLLCGSSEYKEQSLSGKLLQAGLGGLREAGCGLCATGPPAKQTGGKDRLLQRCGSIRLRGDSWTRTRRQERLLSTGGSSDVSPASLLLTICGSEPPAGPNRILMNEAAHEETEAQKFNDLSKMTVLMSEGARTSDSRRQLVLPHIMSHQPGLRGRAWQARGCCHPPALRAAAALPCPVLCLPAWLLLQTPRLLVPQGAPIVLRCHSWKNWRLHKIQFFQDGRPKWFSYTNASFSIPHANASHSGAYHCSGLLGQMQHTSQPVNITVPVSSQAFPPVITAVVAGVAGIIAVAGMAGVVAWFCFRQHHSSGTPENRERGETLPEEPANIANDTDTAAKAEVENTITYSLLLHPEAPEEDAAPSDYQNM
ncbi:PREDICTED: low affinity immunoglobulin gamma Fc region receptor II [Myotis davidii]|uniref:low affinity immunoglobulin gamma Fc region receptor II n=1 Tax=Myotis davidii TaxID=225400 RepID=UPI0007677B1E|nr:PREDICTED: low affinity immunoglobulin gamma Fc region receptor II [Myotis davidii]